ncbi:MAG TPA: translocation/assembly module TamB domain-containing protein, partial [Candidatus Acidoferrum sp.]|nr:translocation/assembly module TamB domain-containing protein [Candidatus Acidoferrum sp.]
MNEPRAKSRWRRFCKYLLLAALAGVLVLGGLAWYATTSSFQAWVRQRLVAQLEGMTGGRVELREFHSVPFRLQIEIRDLTIHGREATNEVPYAHVDSAVAQLKLISVVETEIGFASLVLDHPVIHLITYPDGSTNQPAPRVAKASTGTPIEQLFSLSIGRLELRQGELIWNDQKIPLDFAANDVLADMAYSLLHRKYDGNIVLGKVTTALESYRPVAWTAEIHFVLGRDGVEIKSLTASSGRSRLQASGQLQDFRQPRVQGKYELSLDLADAGSVARRPDVHQGMLQATGQGSWSAATFSSTGKLEVKTLDWRGEAAALRSASLRSDYSLSSNRLTLSQIQAKLMGGDVIGDADILNWLSPASPSTKLSASAEQKGTVRLRLQNLSIAEVAAVLSSSSRPLRRMNLVGDTSGTIDARWRGSAANSETAIALDVVAPKQVAGDQLPLNAHLKGSYRAAGDELEISDLTASTRATQVHAQGKLSSSATVKLSVTTSNLGEWDPVLKAVGYQEQIPVILQGHASFMGTATGKVSAIAFAGKLQSEDFDLLLPRTARAPAKRMHFDSLIADFQLSPHTFALHNAKLHHGEATALFDVTTSLVDREFQNSSPFSAHVEVKHGDVEEFQGLLGYDLPVSGSVNFSGQVLGTKAEPHGSGQLELSNAVVHGNTVQKLDSKFTFSRDAISFDDLSLQYHDARVTGSGAYNFSTRSFRFNLAGNNFDLVGIPQLQNTRVSVEGRVDFTAQASGTLDQPIVTANIRSRDLMLDHERAGEVTFDAVTQGSELHLTGHSQLREANLDIDGKVLLHGDFPASATLRFSHLDVDPVLRTYLKGRLTGHSATDGEIQLQGPLRNPRELEINGTLSNLFADIENIKVRNNGPIRFAIANQSLKLQQFRLIGDGTDLAVTGTVQLGGERQLDLRAQGHANLQLIQSYNPDFTTSGEVAVDLTVAGTTAKPTMQGRLQVTAGSIAYSDLPSALSGINGSLVFNQDRLQVETLTAHVGGGLVTFGGYATAY